MTTCFFLLYLYFSSIKKFSSSVVLTQTLPLKQFKLMIFFKYELYLQIFFFVLIALN